MNVTRWYSTEHDTDRRFERRAEPLIVLPMHLSNIGKTDPEVGLIDQSISE